VSSPPKLATWIHFIKGGSPALLDAAAEALALGTPSALQSLRKSSPIERVQIALSLAQARRLGQEKFSWAGELFADPEGVEVATPERIAKYKAQRFAQALPKPQRQKGTPMLLDLACGIGGDGRELRKVCRMYLGLELDPLRCLMAERNTGGNIRRWDLRKGLPKDAGGLFHFDPLRRQEKRRLRGVEGLLPFLPLLRALVETCEGGCIKLGPEIRREDLEALALPPFSLEQVADSGGVVQALAWLGSLQDPEAPLRATRLLGPSRKGPLGTLRSFAATPLPPSSCAAGLQLQASPGTYLLLPDPLLHHAGLAPAKLQRAGSRASELHPNIGLFLAPTPSEDPWFQDFEILADLPLRKKKIKAWLQKNKGGRITIRTRGHAVKPELWVKELSGSGSHSYCLFALRLGERKRALITRAIIRP